jgi:hypothetical protein
MQSFKVEIETYEEEFCEDDLHEAIIDGLNNVGNYTVKSTKVVKI